MDISFGLSELIKFNNNNIWELVPDNEYPDKKITCYKREIGNRVDNHPLRFNQVINEDILGLEQDNLQNWNYKDWKAFFGENKLKQIASNLSTEQTSLPLIYYMKYIMGFGDDSKMERVNSTRYIFRK